MLPDFITSRFSSRPVELYRFVHGPRPTDVTCYTDGETPVVFDGLTYNPMPVRREKINSSGTLDNSSLEVGLPHTTTVPQLFRVYPPDYVVYLTIFQGDARDPDKDFRPIWIGRVLSVSFEGVEAKLNGEPISTSFRRSGLRKNYQYMCPHVLYGPRCNASKAAATVSATVHSITGRSVALNTTLVNQERFAGGMIEWTIAGVTSARTIISAATVDGRTELLLTGLPTDLRPGSAVSAIRGCRHTLVACRDEHNNAPNYGGCPWIPLTNPIGNVSPFQ